MTNTQSPHGFARRPNPLIPRPLLSRIVFLTLPPGTGDGRHPHLPLRAQDFFLMRQNATICDISAPPVAENLFPGVPNRAIPAPVVADLFF